MVTAVKCYSMCISPQLKNETKLVIVLQGNELINLRCYLVYWIYIVCVFTGLDPHPCHSVTSQSLNEWYTLPRVPKRSLGGLGKQWSTDVKALAWPYFQDWDGWYSFLTSQSFRSFFLQLVPCGQGLCLAGLCRLSLSGVLNRTGRKGEAVGPGRSSGPGSHGACDHDQSWDFPMFSPIRRGPCPQALGSVLGTGGAV